METGKYYQYGWALVVPVVYSLMLMQTLSVNNKPFSDLVEWAPLLISGLAQGIAIVWLMRQLPIRKYRIIAGIAGFPFIFGAFALGGLFGQEGVVGQTNIATAIFVITTWIVARKREGAKRRALIAIGVYFGISVLAPVIIIPLVQIFGL